MSKQTEALKLALEALEETRNALAWFYDSYPQDVTKKGNELLPHVETVLAAIREALAEHPAQQQEPVYVRDKENVSYMFTVTPRLEQMDQEPVAKVCHDLDGHIGWNPNLTQLPEEGTPLYTSPPNVPTARASKPLTRERVREICEGSGYDKATMQERADFINGIRHAEAAHGIKE